MTINEITKAAVSDSSGRPISIPVALRFINSAIRMLAIRFPATAANKTETEITAIKNEWQALPDGLIAVLDTTTTDDNENYRNFICDSGRIKFMNSGDYTIRYAAYNDEITDSVDGEGNDIEAPIDIAYHDLVVIYLLERAMGQHDAVMNLLHMAQIIDSGLINTKRRGKLLPVGAF